MAQTGLLLVPSDALGHTWALPGVLGAGQGLPSETGMHACKTNLTLTRHLGPGALLTRARDVETGLPGESEWRGSRLAPQRERCALHGGT